MPEKIIRDPVHDVIALRLELPGEKLIFRLLATPQMQRLRRIRQLGMASLAYPGADHSRYSHSLGVFETARRMLDRLGREVEITEPRRTACLAAALLHDVGHGPFSHVFERVSGVHHEAIGQRVLLDPDSEVNQVLREYDPQLPARVVGMLTCSPVRDFLCDVLSSQLDADRLDYLLRDNLMTGSRYGDYDLTWLLSALTVDPATRRLAINAKGISAVEAYLQARHHMYRNVYFHKVVRAAEGMVKLALQRAKRLAVQGRLGDTDSPAYKTLLGQQLSSEEFFELDDISILFCFKTWSRSDDAILARLCRGLLQRKLFKTIDLSRMTDAAPVAKIVGEAFAVVESLGGDPHYELFFDEISDTPYKDEPGEDVEATKQILIREPDGKLTNFAAISPFTKALAQELRFRRLHVAEPYFAAVRESAARTV